MSNSLWHQGLYSPCNSLGQNTGVGSLSLLQGIFPTQGSNPGLPHCRQIFYQLNHKWSPRILEWITYPFSSRSSQPRNRTRVYCIAGGFFTNWVIREAFATPWTIQSMEFSRPEYCNGKPFPSPRDLPNPEIEPRSPALQVNSLKWVAYPFSCGSSWLRNWTRVSCIAGGFFTSWAMREATYGTPKGRGTMGNT